MAVPTRKHVDTVLVRQEGSSYQNGVYVSIFNETVGLGVDGGGDAEIWLNLDACRTVLVSLKAATLRVRNLGSDETFSDLHLEQVDDYGAQVPAIVLVSNHRDQVGLYIAIKGDGGGQIWMDVSDCQKVTCALEKAVELLESENQQS